MEDPEPPWLVGARAWSERHTQDFLHRRPLEAQPLLQGLLEQGDALVRRQNFPYVEMKDQRERFGQIPNLAYDSVNQFDCSVAVADGAWNILAPALRRLLDLALPDSGRDCGVVLAQLLQLAGAVEAEVCPEGKS